MTHPTFLPVSTDEPTNLIITTPPGVGTVAALLRQLVASSLDHVLIPARNVEADDLFWERVDGALVVDDMIDAVDVLIIDEASLMTPRMRELIQEVLLERSLLGRRLKALKHVVLVYERIVGAADPEYLELGTSFQGHHIRR